MTPGRHAAPYLVGGAFLASLVAAWEIAGRSADSALAAVLPPPSQFLSVLLDSGFRIGLGSQAVPLAQSILSTLLRVFGGMAIAFVAAVATGALLSLSRFATWCFSPLLYILAPIAPIAWIPTAIVVFGISNVTAVFIVFMGVYFILTIATLAEIRRIPEEYLTVAANLGARPGERWLRVVLPAILPGVFTLLRTNFIAAWMAVLVAEMVGLRDGLGAIIMMGRNLFNSDLIMLGMAVIGIAGFLVDRLLMLIGTRLIWWRV
ncbi:NitT/TauT family transport system permease protein [Tistlia consotensis]|uniref:NitT/TauT family transport system permease protein n=1 Tax=Tistlia consotensis USBA 355 TaxID=560819 RepID=A0A1Y6CDM1_9PROT|nr:ABC transporter permease [Tistlia consotensis]SMF49031.1 NitT/TauT family transport system permease protein [Tistlia consotensis USBA 355]SNR80530.1 NitT/TauT family transport system permease protein [Tistlia consotensis]